MTATPLTAEGSTLKIDTTAVPEVLHWTLSCSANLKNRTTSSTAGVQVSKASKKSYKGTITQCWDSTADPPFVEGDEVTVKMYPDATHFYGVPLVIGERNVDSNIDEAGWITQDFTWENTGPIVEPSFS